MCLEFREGHFDRIQVRRILWQKQEPCFALFQGRHGLGAFVDHEVIEYDDISRLQCWGELGRDVNVESASVHGSGNDPGSREAIATQPGNKGLRCPVAEGRRHAQPRPPFTPSAQARHLGIDGCLVDEDQAFWFIPHSGLAVMDPDVALALNVGSFALRGQQCFFCS